MNILRFLPSILFPLLLLPMAAQEAVEENDERTIDVAISYLGTERTPPMFYRQVDGEFEEIRVSQMRRGPTTEIPLQNDRLALFREVETTDGDKTVKERILLTEVPEEIEGLYVVFYRDSDGNIQRTMIPRNGNGQAPQTARLINLMDKPVFVQLGETKQRVEANADFVIPFEGGGTGTYRRLPYRYAYMDSSGEPDPTNLRRLRIRNDEALVIFFTHVADKLETVDEDGEVIETTRYIEPRDVKFILSAQ